jgi:1-acyl-sn-glycerol-3-phosphate acyltransferase
MTEKPFVPNLGYTWPEDTTKHMLFTAGESTLPEVLDENFPYVNLTLWHRLKRFFLHCAIWTLVFFVQIFRFNLRIEGRENLHKYKKALKNGAITISNHVHKWDLLIALQALRYHRLWVPAWTGNFRGGDGKLMDTIGAIPIPDGYTANKAFNNALDKLHEDKQWVHIYPEAACWPCYQPIRPFKRGAFVYAFRYDVPILPLAISYREVKNPIYKFFKKNNPYITVRIGEPIFPDHTVPNRQGIEEMRQKSHAAMCALAGIALGDNPYPAAVD